MRMHAYMYNFGIFIVIIIDVVLPRHISYRRTKKNFFFLKKMDKVKKLFKNEKNEKDKKYGQCPICNKYNTDYSWCQTCDPQLLTVGWTSGNETIDELIKSTQLKATSYNNYN